MKKESLIQEILNIRKNLPKDFCPIPFTTIILEPDGKVGICRNKGNNFPVGQLSFNNINEIWDIRNNEKAKKWREEFLSGKAEICKEEVRKRKCNLNLYFNDLLPYAQLENHLTNKVLRLTANFNGKCNMQCPSCIIWTLPNGNYTDENFWIPARESLFPFLKEIDMLSGEPFIQADTYKLMEIISEVNPTCRFSITTNMNWNLSDKVKNILDKVEFKTISISIDSFIPEVYHKLRFPGILHQVLNNLEKLIAYRKERAEQSRGFNLCLNFLVQKDNYHELLSAWRFSQKYEMEFYSMFLYSPSELSLLTFDKEKRREILDQYIEEFEEEHFVKFYNILMPLAESLDPIDKVTYLSYLKPPKNLKQD